MLGWPRFKGEYYLLWVDNAMGKSRPISLRLVVNSDISNYFTVENT